MVKHFHVAAEQDRDLTFPTSLGATLAVDDVIDTRLKAEMRELPRTSLLMAVVIVKYK